MLQEATRHYRMALARLPGYGHALAGLARVALAEGRHDDAVAGYEAAERTPTPSTCTTPPAGSVASLRVHRRPPPIARTL